MRNKIKNKLKDDILGFLYKANNYTSSISSISKNLKIDYNLTFVLCDDIITKQLVDSISVSTVDSNKKDKSLQLTPRGKNFIGEGGYRSLHRNENWKKVTSLILPLIATIISLAGIFLTLVYQSGQDRKWAALNVADVEMNDMKMLPFKLTYKAQFDNIKFDYLPASVMIGDTIKILDILCAIDSSTKKILFSSFSFNQIKQFVEKNNLRVYVCRNYRPSFLFQNLGQTPGRNLVIKAEAKTVGAEWLPLSTGFPTKKLTTNMRTAVFGNFFIPFKLQPPDSINFRIYLQYYDILGKEHLDTVLSRWRASDDQFYETNFGE